MIKRFFKIFLAVFGPLFGITAIFFIYIHKPSLPTDPKIIIEKGMPLREISKALNQQGIVSTPWLFSIYVQLSRKAAELKAGEYFFEQPVTPKQVLERLSRGLVVAVKIKVIEGWRLKEIADTLQNLELLKLSQDRSFIESLGIHAASLEGYLFPNTYYIEPSAASEEILRIFVSEFNKNYQKAVGELKILPAYSQHQIVTLASLIEKETGIETERPIIASVFYNRLTKGMPLQSDPTVIYGTKNFDGDIKKADLKNPQPYNTYVHAGLPPGPICNPGLPSIRAALQPAQTDYLYFVSKGDGTHQFSRTAQEHMEAVQQYQLKTE